MSHTDFMEILQAFKEKFPPADSLAQASLRLSTMDIEKMLTEFHPTLEFLPDGIFSALKGLGYKYEPVEENERVTFYWLVKALENSS